MAAAIGAEGVRQVANFSVETIERLQVEIVTNIYKTIMEALGTAMKVNPNLNFMAFYNQHYITTLAQDLTALDSKTRMVFDKIFEMTFILVKKSPLNLIIDTLTSNDGNLKDAYRFIGSFVLPATKELVGRLQTVHPGSMADFHAVWEVSSKVLKASEVIITNAFIKAA